MVNFGKDVFGKFRNGLAFIKNLEWPPCTLSRKFYIVKNSHKNT